MQFYVIYLFITKLVIVSLLSNVMFYYSYFFFMQQERNTLRNKIFNFLIFKIFDFPNILVNLLIIIIIVHHSKKKTNEKCFFQIASIFFPFICQTMQISHFLFAPYSTKFYYSEMI